jgi:hypothetical protein
VYTPNKSGDHGFCPEFTKVAEYAPACLKFAEKPNVVQALLDAISRERDFIARDKDNTGEQFANGELHALMRVEAWLHTKGGQYAKD